MNLNLLAPALQRIINAYDELPENRRCSRHFPKTVADAVEELRSILNPVVENGIVSTGYGWSTDGSYGEDGSRITRHEAKFVWEITEPPDALAKQLLEHGFTFHLGVPTRRYRFPVLRPSKQRITLRGGPLDGCWYLRQQASYNYERDCIGFRWMWPNRHTAWLRYSLPDSHGICYYRE